MTTPVDPARLLAAYHAARDALLAERTAEGFWVGELSSSALATAGCGSPPIMPRTAR